jgi:hypothetical protein
MLCTAAAVPTMEGVKMREFSVSSVKELKGVLRDAGPDVLYRGQTKHYGAVGSPSVVTSFSRMGCVPSEMGKWTYYASDVLERWLGERVRSLQFSQAILQHYGWRSFYLDVSTEPTVAAWFASHVFKDRSRIDLCEDHNEVPVLLRKKRASYEFEDGIGHLYLIGKTLSTERVGAINLSEIHLAGYRPRFSAQAAWMLGPLTNEPLPQACYVGQITADRSVLRAFAAEQSLEGVESLFPPRDEDPVLNSLLSLPWNEISEPFEKRDQEMSLPAFRRTIEVPEYHEGFQKILPPNIALFRNSSIPASVRVDGVPADSIVIATSERVIFGTADPPASRFPMITALVKRHGCVSFEINQLIRHAGFESTALYGKGVSVARREGDLVEVGELVVEHPGMRITRAGLNVGWYYEVDADGIWTRRKHPNECPCGSNYPYQRHLSALTIIDDWLAHQKDGPPWTDS